MSNQLSGGEQQMLAMGRALMTNPKMLLLDEPFVVSRHKFYFLSGSVSARSSYIVVRGPTATIVTVRAF